MDTSKIDTWFKVAVDDEVEDWIVALLLGQDANGHSYSVVTNHVHGSHMAGNPEVSLGAKDDAELIATLLNKYHSSWRSHPAMSDEALAVVNAYNRHSDEHHNADFEVCSDLTCKLAVMLEQAYGWIDVETGTYDEERQ